VLRELGFVLCIASAVSVSACGSSSPSSPTSPASTSTGSAGSTTTTSTTTSTAPPTTGPTTRAWTNVAYATASSANRLDLYLPADGNGPFPTVVFIHGGGFSGGSRSQGLSTAQYLVTRGYAVATIDYRLSGEAKFPAQIHDVKAAIRYLKANASTYFLRADRFATWGESAGAGLAALAGTSGGVFELEDLSMGSAGADSRVQAVVDLFGPINFLTMNSEWKLLGVTNGQDHDAANSPESQLIGAPIQTRPDLCTLYNPETYISTDDPPFIVQHGSADVLIPYLQGKNFADKLASALGPAQVTWMLMDGAGHGGSAFSSSGNLSLLASFLDRSLK